jgi:hypothetical protein
LTTPLFILRLRYNNVLLCGFVLPKDEMMTSKPLRLIDEHLSVHEILGLHPQLLEVFQTFGLEPKGYTALTYESLSATCKVHQLDLPTLLAALEAHLHPLQ